MENLNLCEISFEEAIGINAGHDGTAYEAGRTAMKVLRAAVIFLAFRKVL